MTDDEIIRLFQDAPDDGSDESALRIGRAIRNAALEEAAKMADAHNAIMNTMTAQLIGRSIRALKTKEWQS